MSEKVGEGWRRLGKVREGQGRSEKVQRRLEKVREGPSIGSFFHIRFQNLQTFFEL